MRSRLELILEVEHPEDYDVANQFVYYLCEDTNLDYAPDIDDVFVVVEDWSEV